MAQLNVEPKKSNPWWLWLLLALLGLALLYFFTRDRDSNKNDAVDSDTTANVSNVSPAVDPMTDDWSSIDRNSPAAAYDEVTDRDIEVRGNDQYAIYSVEETVLFDTDKNTIKSGAEEKLKLVAASAEKRFAKGAIRIYGYTDATGTAAYNKQLAEERANAVSAWLAANGNIAQDRISINPVGEAQPAATNETEAGRKQNRRVEIVVRKNSGS